MSIRLTWNNENPLADSVNVYRSASKIVQGSLPAPLATLAGDATEYLDETTSFGVQYHYLVGIVQGGDEALGESKLLLDLPYSGPGPQTLKNGGFNRYGYFGSLTQEEFLFNIELAEKAGLDTKQYLIDGAVNVPQLWHKYFFEGKILFVPEREVCSNISWAQLYQAGLVYGDGTVGEAPYGDPVLQDKRIVVKDSTFVVRLLDGFDGPRSIASITYGDDTDCEWKEIMYRRTGDPSINHVWTRNHIVDGNGDITFDRVVRGYWPGSGARYNTDSVEAERGNTRSTGYNWLPALELRLNE